MPAGVAALRLVLRVCFILWWNSVTVQSSQRNSSCSGPDRCCERDAVCLPMQCTNVKAGRPPTVCDATISNQLFYDNNKKRLSLCDGYNWVYFGALTYGHIGSQHNPAASCHSLAGPNAKSGIYWIKPVHSHCGAATEMFCTFDLMTRGCALVWKHSYMQVIPTNNMRTFSSFNKPCLDLSDGWCNVGRKECIPGSDQVTAAYHHRQLVYAYRGDRNLQLGKSWQEAILNNPFEIEDFCTRADAKAKGVAPEPSVDSNNAFVGITFDKYSPRVYTGNCDTNWQKGKSDCRWSNCHLPSDISPTRSNVQMTMTVYVC